MDQGLKALSERTIKRIKKAMKKIYKIPYINRETEDRIQEALDPLRKAIIDLRKIKKDEQNVDK